MIESLKFDDPNLGHSIDLIKLKMKELIATSEQLRDNNKVHTEALAANKAYEDEIVRVKN